MMSDFNSVQPNLTTLLKLANWTIIHEQAQFCLKLKTEEKDINVRGFPSDDFSMGCPFHFNFIKVDKVKCLSTVYISLSWCAYFFLPSL